MFSLMSDGMEPEAENTIIFALGLMFGLAKDAFGYYFGATARGDEKPQSVKIDQPPGDPVPVEEKNP